MFTIRRIPTLLRGVTPTQLSAWRLLKTFRARPPRRDVLLETAEHVVQQGHHLVDFNGPFAEQLGRPGSNAQASVISITVTGSVLLFRWRPAGLNCFGASGADWFRLSSGHRLFERVLHSDDGAAAATLLSGSAEAPHPFAQPPVSSNAGRRRPKRIRSTWAWSLWSPWFPRTSLTAWWRGSGGVHFSLRLQEIARTRCQFPEELD